MKGIFGLEAFDPDADKISARRLSGRAIGGEGGFIHGACFSVGENSARVDEYGPQLWSCSILAVPQKERAR